MSPSNFVTRSVTYFGQSWFDFKSELEAMSHVQDQAIHVLAGVLLQLLFAALLRRPISSAIPLLAVAALELANEWADIRYSTWPGADARYNDSLLDFFVTLALPTVLLIVSRLYPQVLTEIAHRG